MSRKASGPSGNGHVQKEREREFCFDPGDSQGADLLVGSQRRERQENEPRGGLRVGDEDILASHGRADGAAFIGETYKPKQRKKAHGSRGSRQRGSNHGVMLHEEGRPRSRSMGETQGPGWCWELPKSAGCERLETS